MGKVTIKKVEDRRSFKPVTINLDITFESQGEIYDFQEEFKSGTLSDVSTMYSTVVYDLPRDVNT